MQKLPGYLTTHEFAAKAGVLPVTVRAWLAAKRIRSVRIGRSHLIPASEYAKVRNRLKKPGRPRKS